MCFFWFKSYLLRVKTYLSKSLGRLGWRLNPSFQPLDKNSVSFFPKNNIHPIHPGEKLGTFLESPLNSLQEKWGSVGESIKSIKNAQKYEFVAQPKT
ncbi:hypothetical protein BpHYR1_053890 [Brachionus plicatilis]|uniref:Uncharacterized protein n=1 Tax=Brachionus plicatilis TaxID=10195 RepID=A0A3M7T1E6_BRAPC|nr:hypothetical protein BpHYR1_053890 [Brachionus plicatilis]